MMEALKLFSTESNNKWIIAVAVQPILAILFFAVFGTQELIKTLLVERGINSWLIALVSVAFYKYGVLLVLTSIFLGAAAYTFRLKPWFTALHPCTLLVLSLFAYVLVLLRCLQFPISMDDSYIDYRYVSNLISGQGLVYNPGEHIMGFTSTVHLWVLSLLSIVFPAIEISVLSQSFNVCLEVVSYLVLFRLCLYLLKSEFLAVLSSVMLAISPDIVDESLTGKETSIVIFLLLISIYAVQSHRVKILAWSSTLLFLSRPEGILAVVVALPFTFDRKQPRNLFSTWLFPGLLATAWYVFLFYYYGTIVPHGAIGKALSYHPKDVGQTFIELLLHFAMLVNHLPIHLVMSTPASFISIIGVVIVALIFLLFRELGLRFYALLMLAVAAFFSVSNPVMFPWYFAWFQLVTPFLLPLLVRLFLSMKALNIRVRQTVAVLCVCYFAALPFAQRQDTSGGILTNVLFTLTPMSGRLAVYKEAGDYCNGEKITDDVAAGEIGMFGHVWKHHVTDLVGLISDSVLKYYPVPKGQRSNFLYSVPVRLANEMSPKYMLVLDQMLDNGLANNENFHKRYFVKKRWPFQVWGSKALELYQRNDNH